MTGSVCRSVGQLVGWKVSRWWVSHNFLLEHLYINKVTMLFFHDFNLTIRILPLPCMVKKSKKIMTVALSAELTR